MTSQVSHTAPSAFYARSPFFFILALAVVVAGFTPSYFSALRTTDAAHHFHGMTATAWMVMLIVQGFLARGPRLRWHRVIGKTSLLIAPLFVVSGLMIMGVMLRSTGGFNRAFGARLAFVDFVTLLGFAGAYLAAIVYRKDVRLHARFLASTAVLALPPALARLFGNYIPAITSFEAAFHAAYAVAEVVVLVLLIDDKRRGAFSIPYLLLGGLFAVQHAGFFLITNDGVWASLAHRFLG